MFCFFGGQSAYVCVFFRGFFCDTFSGADVFFACVSYRFFGLYVCVSGCGPHASASLFVCGLPDFLTIFSISTCAYSSAKKGF